MDTINLHTIACAREILEHQDDVKRVLDLYRFILQVWLCEVNEARTFVTQHIKQHGDLLLLLTGCPFNHTETNSWARIAMHNLNAYSDKMSTIKGKTERQIEKLE